jgi:hypothetical protein
MKAVRLLEYGGQLVFNDVPTPTLACDEILVKINAFLRSALAPGHAGPPALRT